MSDEEGTSKSNEDSSSDQSDSEEELNEENKDIYLPGAPLKDGESLVHDETAYKVFHQAQTGAPCLSFDVIKDDLGENRTEFPATVYIVAGTNSSQGQANHVLVMKMSNMHTVKDIGSDEDDSDSDSESPEKPVTQVKTLKI